MKTKIRKKLELAIDGENSNVDASVTDNGDNQPQIDANVHPPNNSDDAVNESQLFDENGENSKTRQISGHEENDDLLDKLKSKCQNLPSDAYISAEVVEEATRDGELLRLEHELDDLKRYEGEYATAHEEIVALVMIRMIDTQEFEDHRRKFLLFAKRLKSKISAISKPIKDTTDQTTKRLKFGKIEIPIFDGQKDKWKTKTCH